MDNFEHVSCGALVVSSHSLKLLCLTRGPSYKALLALAAPEMMYFSPWWG